MSAVVLANGVPECTAQYIQAGLVGVERGLGVLGAGVGGGSLFSDEVEVFEFELELELELDVFVFFGVEE